MSSVAELTPALTWMSDADKRCTYVNTAWMVFTGRTLEAVIGDGWRETIHPDDLPRCLEFLDAAFEQHQPFTLEYRLRRHDGEYRWILDSGIPLLTSDGSSTGYVGSIVDITERRRAEELLRRKECELTEAQRLAGIGSWQWDPGARTMSRGRTSCSGSRDRIRLARGCRGQSSAAVSAGTLGTDCTLRRRGDAIRHAVRTRR